MPAACQINNIFELQSEVHTYYWMYLLFLKGQARSGSLAAIAYQLDPGVDANSDGIYWLHVVPPVSGNIKHLWGEKTN